MYKIKIANKLNNSNLRMFGYNEENEIIRMFKMFCA